MKRSANSTRVLIGLACVALAFSIDQMSKFEIVEIIMSPPREIYINAFLNIVLSYNTGISFGILSGYFSSAPSSLSFLTSVVVGFLFIWMLYAKTNVSVVSGSQEFQLDALKFQGSRSSMRLLGYPFAMASSVALR